MNALHASDFDRFHQAIHGYPPFSWQVRLLHQVLENKAWPKVLDLPTGSGKTTCIDIALFLIAITAEDRPRWCPRRIAMIVDRRVVVDQVAKRGQKLRDGLIKSGDPVVLEVARRLNGVQQNSLANDEDAEPLGVFTLRGGMPRDDSWARLPHQPLIIASTVDQLGSRLLMQGYGVSPRMSPIHAGLAANDILILLDEVHLSIPFAQTLQQVDEMRKRWEVSPSKTAPFDVVMLSATPNPQVKDDLFRLLPEEREGDGVLAKRLRVSKPATLHEVPNREALEAKATDLAKQSLDHHSTVLVVMNRVASALTVYKRLQRELKEKATDVILMTGRMRPLDRDDLLAEILPRVTTNADRTPSEKKLVVVGTQCVEAGADFDFDALVSEAASLDALRQRFGRVNRAARPHPANGHIIRDKSVDDDPVYGESLARTFKWMKANSTEKRPIDFGISSLVLPPDDQLVEMIPKARSAPELLPAYLDAWAETSATRLHLPEVSLWLHGPESEHPNVQVIWRADLSRNAFNANDSELKKAGRDRALLKAIAGIPPSSLEAVAIPLLAARSWLAGLNSPESASDLSPDIHDVEGVTSPESREDQATRPESSAKASNFLRWRDDVLERASSFEIMPGDTVVVPAVLGGLTAGSFDPTATDAVKDLAERASLLGRGRPVLRLHSSVLADLGLPVQWHESEDALADIRQTPEGDGSHWRKVLLQLLRRYSTKCELVGPLEAKWKILRGRPVRAAQLRELLLSLRSEESGKAEADEVEIGADLSTDPEASSFVGCKVLLSNHSRDVERFAGNFARSCGLDEEKQRDFRLAGWLHDIGKSDRRFQIYLRGGSEMALLRDSEALAKSEMPPDAKAERDRARRLSGYPAGERHELLSWRMAKNPAAELCRFASDWDLVLHLVSSHHGWCRPLPPLAAESSAPLVEPPPLRSDEFGVLSTPKTQAGPAAPNELHELTERWDRLIQRYGWWQLCWFEAIFRLADHRASEWEESAAESPSTESKQSRTKAGHP